ncbi:DUF2161 domain-containing phosphodiesterase [Oceanicola sp. S124]|uniref:DUF2161 domain-containing phosphodiesterase n=1 Tax=Oceanicola sp. S124 TaxID=1042378 RepID=UPI00025599CD|nr:DUF2161 domain-containing phosphodiesterase [Oceanicola sp. S124]
MSSPSETDLYPPVKAFLEGQGYEVKSEIAGADVVGMRADDPDPVIVELKLAMSLALLHQALERLKITDFVYLAIPQVSARKTLARHVALCRRLGLGLLTVRLRDGFVEAQCDPSSYAPRKVKARAGRLLREFQRRDGDPNRGGAAGKIVTAYRQDAVRCALHLAGHGPCRGAEVKAATGVGRATTLMRDNHYGWFEKVAKGTYALTERGRQETGA